MKVANIVLIFVAIFAVCWLPSHVAFLTEAYASIHVNGMAMVAFQIGATCLAYINSCLNPVIYTFLSENFSGNPGVI